MAVNDPSPRIATVPVANTGALASSAFEQSAASAAGAGPCSVQVNEPAKPAVSATVISSLNPSAPMAVATVGWAGRAKPSSGAPRSLVTGPSNAGPESAAS